MKKSFLFSLCLCVFIIALPVSAEKINEDTYPYPSLSVSDHSFIVSDSISNGGKIWKTLQGTMESDMLSHGALRYNVYLPEKYNASKKYPLVVYLHGSSVNYKRYPDETPWTQTLNAYLAQLADALPDTMGECILFAPQVPGGETQTPAGSTWTNTPGKTFRHDTEDKSGASFYLKVAAKQMHTFITRGIPYGDKLYQVNIKRVYLIGDSQGGFGAYALLNECPTLFAAVMVRAGLGNPDTVSAWKDTPIRIFHGEKDESVSYEGSKKMIEALKAAGARDAELITIEDGAHDVRYHMYQTYDKKGKNVYLTWLSEQRRSMFSVKHIVGIGIAALFCLGALFLLLRRFRHKS